MCKMIGRVKHKLPKKIVKVPFYYTSVRLVNDSGQCYGDLYIIAAKDYRQALYALQEHLDYQEHNNDVWSQVRYAPSAGTVKEAKAQKWEKLSYMI